MSDPTSQPTSVLGLLFGREGTEPGPPDQSQMAQAVAPRLGVALHGLPPGTMEAAVREATTAAAGLVDFSLTDLLVAGWRTHEELIAAARRTVAAPASTELVDLAEHRVTSTDRPYVNVFLDGDCVATIHLELSVTFDVSAMLAGVRRGRLVELHSGRCDVTATLSVEGDDVATRRGHLELPGVITLGDGIPLLTGDDGPDELGHSALPGK
jgi:hypothetical protein